MNASILSRTQVTILLNFFESNKSAVNKYPRKEDLQKVIAHLRSDLFFMNNIQIGNSWVEKSENTRQGHIKQDRILDNNLKKE